MKNLIMIVIAFMMSMNLTAQNSYVTKDAYAKLFSTTDIEDIEAENFKVVSKLTPSTGDFVVSVTVQSFKFEKALMQKHFNETNYMDSQSFPKIKFSGKIDDLAKVDFTKDGKYEVTVSGDLTIRDVTKPVSEKGTIEVKDGKVSSESVFMVKNIYQYGIGRPPMSSKKDAIAEDIKITFKAKYE